MATAWLRLSVMGRRLDSCGAARLGFSVQPRPRNSVPALRPVRLSKDPPELRSQNGVLEVTLHFRYQVDAAGQGPPRYCYVTDEGMKSPTLRVHPGDQLIIHLHNDLPGGAAVPRPAMPKSSSHAGTIARRRQ